MKLLCGKSERVKSVDIHPNEPWILSALFSGDCFIWDYEQAINVKTFDVCELPVRAAKFIVRKHWIVTASDDFKIRIFNYNTMEKIKEFDAHTDYIRYLEIHPTRSIFLSCSDDMTVKMWDWEKNFECTQTFEGHSHYVMMVRFNPRDPNNFATASLDRSVKVWGITSATPHFSLEGHERGVNCVEYAPPGSDKPYILSGADDKVVKVWDYQTRACLQTLERHSHNVTAVLFHPRLPVILSASEDGTVRLWHSVTYRAECTLNYGMERVWSLAADPNSHKIAIGCDEGTVVVKLGREMPIASLDANTSKIVWARGIELQTCSLRGLASGCSEGNVQDGDSLQLSCRDMGACELFPQALSHNCNGHFISVCGDGEFNVYSSQALRSKSFGSALDLVWSNRAPGDYCVRESISRVKIFKNFADHKQLRLSVSSAEGIFGGSLIGVKGADCIVFHDWETGDMIRRIDVLPTNAYWNESSDLVALACEDILYVLKYNSSLVDNAILMKRVDAESGVEGSFELQYEVNESVKTGQWIGDCFLFTNSQGRLNYCVGGHVITLTHLERRMYLLGYIPRENSVFLIDKQSNVVSYKLLQETMTFQTAVVRQDFAAANAVLTSIPASEHVALARFLEGQGMKKEAMMVTPDAEQKFDLALELKEVEVAHQLLLSKTRSDDDDDNEQDSAEACDKWRRLGDVALTMGLVDLAKECCQKSHDLSSLLTIYCCEGDIDGVLQVAEEARRGEAFNIAFTALFVSGRVEQCIELLVDTCRFPEAALMARTYMPSQISRVIKLWREDLSHISVRASEALADPDQYPNLFPDLATAISIEQMFFKSRDTMPPVLASSYSTSCGDLNLNLIDMFKQQQKGGDGGKANVSTPSKPSVQEASSSVNHSTNSSSSSSSVYQAQAKPISPSSPVSSSSLAVDGRAAEDIARVSRTPSSSSSSRAPQLSDEDRQLLEDLNKYDKTPPPAKSPAKPDDVDKLLSSSTRAVVVAAKSPIGSGGKKAEFEGDW